MRLSLSKLFSMLENDEPVNAGFEYDCDLFGFCGQASSSSQSVFQKIEKADIDFIAYLYSGGFSLSSVTESVRNFYELSINAFSSFVQAWMSEMPIEAEIVKFGRRVISAAKKNSGALEENRKSAEIAASDSGDFDTLTVLSAAEKVQCEIHKMMGLLRFSPDKKGVYTAKCAPDHLILPALGDYFTARFADTAWVIIDEKRAMFLRGKSGGQAEIFLNDEESVSIAAGSDDWESLWRHYHKTINNESRNNPNLQRQFMPKRYWKYLPEKS